VENKTAITPQDLTNITWRDNPVYGVFYYNDNGELVQFEDSDATINHFNSFAGVQQSGIEIVHNFNALNYVPHYIAHSTVHQDYGLDSRLQSMFVKMKDRVFIKGSPPSGTILYLRPYLSVAELRVEQWENQVTPNGFPLILNDLCEGITSARVCYQFDCSSDAYNPNLLYTELNNNCRNCQDPNSFYLEPILVGTINCCYYPPSMVSFTNQYCGKASDLDGGGDELLLHLSSDSLEYADEFWNNKPQIVFNIYGGAGGC